MCEKHCPHFQGYSMQEELTNRVFFKADTNRDD